eukprot:10140909-Ditylum_brightwellii.AAC.1
MREEMHQKMKTLKENMKAHMDKTLSKMVSESRKMMKEETSEIGSMFSSVMEKLDNINNHGKNQLVTPQKTTRYHETTTNVVTPRQKKHGAMKLS